MSLHPANDTFKKQQSKLIPAVFKRGTISAVNVGSRVVDIFFDESPQTVVRGISLAAGIDPTTLQPGMKAGIHTYDETSPQSMVVSHIIGQTVAQPDILVRAPVPSNSSAAGSLGQISWDTNYFYIAIGNNSWKRVALSSF